MLSTLLYINQNVEEQQVLRSSLKNTMPNVYLISAYSYPDALRILAIVKPDAILFDTELFGINEHNILQQITALENAKQTPLYILTVSMECATANSVKSVADGIFYKPSAIEEYTNVISEINTRLSLHSYSCI